MIPTLRDAPDTRRFGSSSSRTRSVLKDPSGTLPSFMSPAVDICLRFLSFDLVELSLLHHGVAKDISCVGGNQGKFVFMLRQNGDWRKISSFLLSDNFNYGLLTDAGNCTQSSFPTLFNISMIELFSNNLKRWCVPSLPFPTVHGPFVVHIPHQKMQKKKKEFPPQRFNRSDSSFLRWTRPTPITSHIGTCTGSGTLGDIKRAQLTRELMFSGTTGLAPWML